MLPKNGGCPTCGKELCYVPGRDDPGYKGTAPLSEYLFCFACQDVAYSVDDMRQGVITKIGRLD